jgi:LuxR family maltose regulon positive regulatory protein
MEHALTLISAPAGFGKTTLLAQWLASTRMPVAWLSVDVEDNDPTRFLAYLIAALQTLDAQLGTTALALLRTPQPPSPEAVLAQLANDLVSIETEDVALVLDDYHLITAESIQRGMTFLLEHLPRTCTSSWPRALTPHYHWLGYGIKASSVRYGLLTYALEPPT